MALVTLGAGFATGEPLYFVAGVTAYVLGWVYLPDMAFFQRWRSAHERGNQRGRGARSWRNSRSGARRCSARFRHRLRERYHVLAKVCRDIERAAAESEQGSELNLTSDTRLRKIDELMWMYLRLLSMQQSLETFLETERREDLRGEVAESETETNALEAEIKTLRDRAQIDAKLRLLEFEAGAPRSLAETFAARRGGGIEPRAGPFRTGAAR